MSDAFVLAGKVEIDGSDAANELARVKGSVADATIAMGNAKGATRDAAAALTKHRQEAKGDADELVRLAAALRAAQIAEIEQSAALKGAAAAYRQYNQAQGAVTNSAGQMRSSMTNLGQQIGDISQGFAAGVNPAMIFAQQSGQVAFALQGMGGALGKVGAFLGGPWGIALTSAMVLLSPFVGKLFEGGDAAEANAAKTKTLKEALLDLDRATGFANHSQEESIRLAREAIRQSAALAGKKREEAAAELAAARARVASALADAQEGGASAKNFGGNFVTANAQADVARLTALLDELDKTIAESDAKAKQSVIFGNAMANAAAANDPRAKITQRYDREIEAIRALKVTQDEADRLALSAMQRRDAALQTVEDSTRSAAKATRDAAKETREWAKELDGLVAAVNRSNNALTAHAGFAVPGLTSSVRDLEANRAAANAELQAKDREQSGLAAMVDAASARLQAGVGEVGDDMGNKAGDAFARSATDAANSIGQIIGGKAGSAMSQLLGLVGGIGPKANGLTGGAPSGLGSLFSGFNSSFAETVGKPFAKSATKISDVFGGGAAGIGKGLGQAFGGAATGSMVSGIASAVGIKLNQTGSAVGGAIGSFIPIPGGQIIGSIVGGVVGNLLTGVKKGSASVSINDGASSITSGGNSAALTKASSTQANSIVDGLQAIADQLGGSLGNAHVSVGQRNKDYTVDPTGKGRTKGSSVLKFKTQEEALAAGLADAIRDGGVETSPRVQAALLKYADNVNKAVAEALKVKSVEDLVANAANPFASVMRDFEAQAKKRVQIARDYGFDVLEIEKINADERKRLLDQALQSAVGSAKSLLAELTHGNRAEGSYGERRAALLTERDRLQGLAASGDLSANDKLTQVLQQLLDVSKEGYGAASPFATDRADTVTLLQQLIGQNEARLTAASTAAQSPDPQLTEANSSLDDLVKLNQEMVSLLRSGSGGGGGGSGNASLGLFARFVAV